MSAQHGTPFHMQRGKRVARSRTIAMRGSITSITARPATAATPMVSASRKMMTAIWMGTSHAWLNPSTICSTAQDHA